MLNLACPRAHALRLFLLGLFQGSLKFGRELQFVFQEIVEQNTELRELRPREVLQFDPDLFDLAHGSNSRLAAVAFKPEFSDR